MLKLSLMTEYTTNAMWLNGRCIDTIDELPEELKPFFKGCKEINRKWESNAISSDYQINEVDLEIESELEAMAKLIKKTVFNIEVTYVRNNGERIIV